ncbi:hypothetical protein [Tissierella carlieri]|uniref:Uncharacterized protein n=1 Tax=Tissierella carlieri TaxID=689904 RepID=A0ABT1S7Q6_9FIRM|nr:hypothetical protein [Tissierella carlieri]MCQ4922489.1 hypothetical protein [Tissierella carlieri]MDU5081914.1 hypothetical protein [Bacillota bacterium]
MKDYIITISNKTKSKIAIVGHVGVGHVHSHSSFVQDDSVGFAVVASLMREVLNVDTRIKHVKGDLLKGDMVVETYGGGIGRTFCRRGITPMELELMNRAVDEDGIYTQRTAIKAFGRMYGQGVMEVPAALQGAIALAVLDSFHKKNPNKVHITSQKYSGRIDKMAGMIADINGIPVSLLLNINGSEGGIGPNEDNEGNTAIGVKGELMKSIGIDNIPTIIVESKAYIPKVSDDIEELTFLFRAQEGLDNLFLAKVLSEAAKEAGIPYIYFTDSLPQEKGQLAKATVDFANKIIRLGEELKSVDDSTDKVEILADMAKLISEDAGGVTFMSNSLHEVVRSPGIVPDNAAVISLLVPTEYIKYWKIPMLSVDDINGYKEIIIGAIDRIC